MMAELQDGEAVEIEGWGEQKYTIAREGIIYSCTCPKWQSKLAPPQARTCKHLKEFLGAENEVERVDAAFPSLSQIDEADKGARPLMDPLMAPLFSSLRQLNSDELFDYQKKIIALKSQVLPSPKPKGKPRAKKMPKSGEAAYPWIIKALKLVEKGKNNWLDPHEAISQLTHALNIYDALCTAGISFHGYEINVARSRGMAYFLLARIYQSISDYPSADASFKASIDHYQAVEAENSDHYKKQFARLLVSYAKFLQQQNDHSEAVELTARADAIMPNAEPFSAWDTP